jgi:hypothetical protein
MRGQSVRPSMMRTSMAPTAHGIFAAGQVDIRDLDLQVLPGPQALAQHLEMLRQARQDLLAVARAERHVRIIVGVAEIDLHPGQAPLLAASASTATQVFIALEINICIPFRKLHRQATAAMPFTAAPGMNIA